MLVLVLALAAVLRIYDLRNFPAGLYCDEAGLGYNAYALAKAGIDENGERLPLYVWSFGVSYKNPVFIYAATIPITLFGLDEFSVRLTAALFGFGTVLAMYFLGRALFDRRVGLLAALFLAVCPWHLHFSRIAFELISFPFLFVVGFALLVRFVRGGRTLPAALLFFSLCVYAYAIANLFVPLFLLGFALLHAGQLLSRMRETLLALAVVVATLAPAVIFLGQHQTSGTLYFRRTTFLDASQDWRTQLDRFVHNYQEFFSRSFLIDNGDPLVRHSLRGFGELHSIYVPFLLLGIVVVALRRERTSQLILWWLVLYPVGPSLMTEIPSASRAIIGAPVFCLLAAIGFDALVRVLDAIAARLPRFRFVRLLAVTAGLAILGLQTARYVRAYFLYYPLYAAPSTAGFQFGYREMIHYMESQRHDYDDLLITMSQANQPHIFTLFYNRIDPRRWVAERSTGYRFLKPEQYQRYKMGRRVLFALRPDEVDLFSDYTVKRQIVTPAGKTAFVVADVRERKRYLDGWLALGPFPNEGGSGVAREFVEVRNLERRRYEGAFGPVVWQRVRQSSVYVDLNDFYADTDPRTPGNPEWVCAYLVTRLTTDAALDAHLELNGSWDDTASVWLNGRSLTPWPLTMGNSLHTRSIHLPAGDSYLLIKSCEGISYWELAPRITDAAGRELRNVRSAPELPRQPFEAAVEERGAAVQVVEGFDQVVDFRQHEDAYPDYRGEGESWRASIDRGTSVTWRTKPVPERRQTSFLFTASTSDERAEFLLFVDGRYALTFESSNEPGVRIWERDGIVMTFVSRAAAAGNAGFVVLNVPEARVTPGQPVEIRVQAGKGEPLGWFMIKAYEDTAAHERFTPGRAAASVENRWSSRPRPFSE
jgi:4-amino-4-deoxy-L-arabinose transferase-like glycosyltransferase